MPQSSQTPHHAIKFSEQVMAFELSHTEFGSNLAAISLPNKLIIGTLRFPEESEEEEFYWQILREIHCDSLCYSLCFAPETSLAKLPKVVTLCAAGGDFLLRIFRTDMQNTDRVQELKGHTSYVNDIAWDSCGEYIASVSDDQSCIVWHSEDNFESTTKFCLASAGVAVKWHVDDPAKLMIAEKKGIIKMYNVKTEQAIMSLESSNIPLMNADWSIHNRFIVTGVGAGNVITWDLRRSSQPIDVKQIHEDCGKIVKISPLTESVTASIGCPDTTLKVNTSKSHIPLVEFSLSLYGGLCWHNHLPYVAAANDRKLCFWKVQIK
ncbi:NUP37 family protein [Megaselia abdita]